MYVCYVDESGGFEAPNSGPRATPLMVFAGLIVEAAAIRPLTADFLALKRRFYPGEVSRHLDYVLAEVKGAELRKAVRVGSQRERRHAFGVLDGVMRLIEHHDIWLVGRIWVKEPAKALEPDSTYTYAVQDIARNLDHFLGQQNTSGLVICDGRDHRQDVRVAHSVFTQKHKSGGDALPRLIETPLFGKSDNHVGLQIADLVASALLFPMAARVYCEGGAKSFHAHPQFDALRTRYARRLRARRHVYVDSSGRTRGGIVVSDRLGRRPPQALFEIPGGTRQQGNSPT
ncbi:DUF3800 domain-containing protein [Candidatus Poriferisodalis sp.]|uniref:DUF3800 domain-containing protein n=1 Tax=Candidatus Poriferisodalis sp. TaxID=3101277 RepID=UPI003B52FD39